MGWSHVTKGTKKTNNALYQLPERLGYSNPGLLITTYTKYISSPKGVTLSAAEIERMAQDRIAWKRLVLDCSKAIAKMVSDGQSMSHIHISNFATRERRIRGDLIQMYKSRNSL